MMEPVDAPAWLVSAVDQRLASIEEAGVSEMMAGFDHAMSPLVEPEPGQDIKVWDETCDRCGRHRPGRLFTGHTTTKLSTGQPVTFVFGVCPECKEKP